MHSAPLRRFYMMQCKAMQLSMSWEASFLHHGMCKCLAWPPVDTIRKDVGCMGKHIEIPDADTTMFFIPRMSIISVMLDDGKAHTLPLSYAHIGCQLPNCVSHGEATDTLIANHQHSSACMLERGWRRCRNQHNQ